MSKDVKAISVPDSGQLRDKVAQYMERPDVCDRFLDAWASYRTVRLGIGSDCRYDEAFPKNPSPDPVPFPKNHRGETVIRDEVEEGSERKYGERPRFDESMESMAECVERSLQKFKGPGYMKGLLLTVHPLGNSRYRSNPYPDDPFADFAERENGPNVSQITKKHQATTYLHVYRSFRRVLLVEVRNVEQKTA